MKRTGWIVGVLAASLAIAACDETDPQWVETPTGKMLASQKFEDPGSAGFNLASGMILGWQGPSGCKLKAEFKDLKREEMVRQAIEALRTNQANLTLSRNYLQDHLAERGEMHFYMEAFFDYLITMFQAKIDWTTKFIQDMETYLHNEETES